MKSFKMYKDSELPYYGALSSPKSGKQFVGALIFMWITVLLTFWIPVFGFIWFLIVAFISLVGILKVVLRMMKNEPAFPQKKSISSNEPPAPSA